MAFANEKRLATLYWRYKFPHLDLIRNDFSGKFLLICWALMRINDALFAYSSLPMNLKG